MEAAAILAIIQSLTQAVPSIVGLISASKATWSATDLATVEAALGQMQAQAETDWTRVRAELVAAAAQ